MIVCWNQRLGPSIYLCVPRSVWLANVFCVPVFICSFHIFTFSRCCCCCSYWSQASPFVPCTFGSIIVTSSYRNSIGIIIRHQQQLTLYTQDVCIRMQCCVIESRHSPYFIYISAIRSITVWFFFFSSVLTLKFICWPGTVCWLLLLLFFSLCFFAFLCRWFNVTLTMLTRCSSLLVRSFFSHIFMFGVCHRRAVCWFILFVRHLTLAHFRWVGRSMLHLFFPHCALDTHNMFYIIQILNKHKTNAKQQWWRRRRQQQQQQQQHNNHSQNEQKQKKGSVYMASARLTVRKKEYSFILYV